MAAYPQQTIDRIIPSVTEDKLVEPDTMKEQPLPAKSEKEVSNDTSKNDGIGHPTGTTHQSESFGSGGDQPAFSSNLYAPETHRIYYEGFENAPDEWDEYHAYANAEQFDIGSQGIYSDNPSLVFHTGYGYSPQTSYPPHSSVTTPLPSGGGDAQLYCSQQYQFSAPAYYQQLVPHSMQYITQPAPFPQPELSSVLSLNQEVDGMLFGPRPSYPSLAGSFGRSHFSGNLRSPGFYDVQQGYDAFRSGRIWSDWPKSSDQQGTLTPFSPMVSQQPIGRLGSFGQHFGMDSQLPSSSLGFESGSNAHNGGYLCTKFNQSSSFGSASVPSFDYERHHRRADGSQCYCSGTLDILNEQNRGPRASKTKSQIAIENGASVDNNKYTCSARSHGELYNPLDIVTEYKSAKFFVIKSYSEDNVHKSIKYGVWASTSNGNRKLDTAYNEVKGQQSSSPIFLFFSVNASGQFCGVAEMVGPVDFDKSVDYWQQDKWSGQFPICWHIIKDVPNSRLRHIVLKNNDNKPVTNSRDTQEVSLEQGMEMLNIFKNYRSDVSILDDFDFYEDRQKAMQERKARQQAGLVGIGIVGETGCNNVVTVSNNFIEQISKSFTEVVRLDESDREGSLPRATVSASDGSMGNRVKLEDAMATAALTTQNS